MAYFNDDGSEYNPDLYSIPSLYIIYKTLMIQNRTIFDTVILV